MFVTLWVEGAEVLRPNYFICNNSKPVAFQCRQPSCSLPVKGKKKKKKKEIEKHGGELCGGGGFMLCGICVLLFFFLASKVLHTTENLLPCTLITINICKFRFPLEHRCINIKSWGRFRILHTLEVKTEACIKRSSLRKHSVHKTKA